MRKFVCTESGNVYTEDELVALYCESLKEDSSLRGDSFYDWMRNASGKNGTLREFKPLSTAHRDLLFDAIKQVRGGMKLLNNALDTVSEESFNRNLSEHYPFKDSFAEAYWEFIEWLDTVKGSVDDLEAFY